jgi:hypothetical protein
VLYRDLNIFEWNELFNELKNKNYIEKSKNNWKYSLEKKNNDIIKKIYYFDDLKHTEFISKE